MGVSLALARHTCSILNPDNGSTNDFIAPVTHRRRAKPASPLLSPASLSHLSNCAQSTPLTPPRSPHRGHRARRRPAAAFAKLLALNVFPV